MAAWQIIPPTSVTIAAAFRMATTMSVLVMGVTSTWACWSARACSMLNTRCTKPDPAPGLAGIPMRRGTAFGLLVAEKGDGPFEDREPVSFFGRQNIAVIGRD